MALVLSSNAVQYVGKSIDLEAEVLMAEIGTPAPAVAVNALLEPVDRAGEEASLEPVVDLATDDTEMAVSGRPVAPDSDLDGDGDAHLLGLGSTGQPREHSLTPDRVQRMIEAERPDWLTRRAVGDVLPDGVVLNTYGTELLARWDADAQRLIYPPAELDELGQVRRVWHNGFLEAEHGVAALDLHSMRPLWSRVDSAAWQHSGMRRAAERLSMHNLETGEPLWSLESPNALPWDRMLTARSAPDIFVGGGEEHPQSAVRVDLETGEVRWSVAFPSSLGGRDSFLPYRGEGVFQFERGLARVDPQSGRLMWTRADMAELGDGFQYRDGLFGTARSPALSRIDLETGDTVWSNPSAGIDIDFELPAVRGSNGTRFVGGPVASENGHRDRSVAILDPGTGDVVFETADLADLRVRFDTVGIERVERFYGRDFAEHVLEHRERFDSGDWSIFAEPVTVLLLPEHDDNGVFAHNNFDALMHDSTVLAFEIGDDNEFFSVMDEVQAASRQQGRALHRMVLAGHAVRSRVSWGDRDPALGRTDSSRTLDLSDRRALVNFDLSFEDSEILIYGCEVGEGEHGRDNIVNLLAETLGRRARQISGPTASIAMYFDTDADGAVSGFRTFDVSGVDRSSEIHTRAGLMWSSGQGRDDD